MGRARVGLGILGAAAALLALGFTARDVFRDESASTVGGVKTSAQVAPPPGLAGSPGRAHAAQVDLPRPTAESVRPVDPEAWLERLNGAESDVAAEKALLDLGRLPPEDALAALRAIYSRIEPAARRHHVIDHFTAMARYQVHEYAASILDLAVLDPDEVGARWALANAANFALRPLSLDDGTYAQWRREILDLRVGDVLTLAARTASRRIATAGDAELLRVLKESGDLHTWFAPHHGVDVAPIARAEGAWDRCLKAFRDASLATDARGAALDFLVVLGIDRAFVDRYLLPIVLRQAEAPAELVLQAAGLVLKHGGPEGMDAVLGVFERFPPDLGGVPLWVLLATAFYGMDAKRAIPTLIAALDESALEVSARRMLEVQILGLSGTEGSAGHDATWWRAWWVANRARLSPDFATLDVPTLHLPPR